MHRIRDSITAVLHRGEQWLFANPRIVLGLILAVTLGFSTRLPALRIYTDFNDLLPQRHPYIQTYNRIKERFGGANQIVLVVEAEGGTIFDPKALALIYDATQGVDDLPYINHNLVTSLAHRTVRKAKLASDGNVVSELYYDPAKPPSTQDELQQLQKDVIANPQVYGLLVSPNLKAAMVKAQLNEERIDYRRLISAVQELRAKLQRPGFKIYITGNPVLTGYVYTYLNQIISIMFGTLALLAALLVIYFRRLYGILLPLIGICLSSVWGLGFMALCGFNLEPLSMPIPFLIAARATSHGVQLVARYYEELALTHDGPKAARNALEALFRPGSLAIIVDSVGIGVLVLGTAPFNHKMGLSAGFWALSVIFTVHFMVPLALSVLPQPRRTTNNNAGVRKILGSIMAHSGGTRTGAIVILGVAAAAVVLGGLSATHVQIGESEPGSPLLKRNHDYNLSTKAINELFPGSDELHVLVSTKEKNGLKRPEVLHAIESLQADMLLDADTGGTKALPLVIRQVNRLTHYGAPRWEQIPDSAKEIGGLMFTYMAASPVPGALQEFVSPANDQADVVFYYKDHRVATVDGAMAQARRSIAAIGSGVAGMSIELAGGIVGVTAASNEALHRDHMLIIPIVMAMAFLLVTAYYQSLHAGWLMVLPMLFSTIMTYAYMGIHNICINVNTVPVIAVGVGVGIDYAVYFMDRIREEMHKAYDIRRAAIVAISTTGYAVSFTAVTLIAGVVLWIFMSDLRFQADAAQLLSFMLIVNAIAAMLIVPSWCVLFEPKFVVGNKNEEEGNPRMNAKGGEPSSAARVAESLENVSLASARQ